MNKKFGLNQMILCFLFGILVGVLSVNILTLQKDDSNQYSSVIQFGDTLNGGNIAGVSEVLYDLPYIEVEAVSVETNYLSKVGSSFEEFSTTEEDVVIESDDVSITNTNQSIELQSYDLVADNDVRIVDEIDGNDNSTEIITEEVEIEDNSETLEDKCVENVDVVETVSTSDNLIKIQATAYHDAKTADGTKPHYGVLAGKREWLGKRCRLYDEDKNLIGEFEFHDVGYGRPTGEGKTSFECQSGKSKGTIETGKTIDIYMDSISEAFKWGNRTVYMEWIDE